MSKIGDYLDQHLVGEVIENGNSRLNFATDSSILSITPHLIVMPRVLDDVRKLARFAWRLAERGQVLPLTARGYGNDVTGGAISSGVVLSFLPHMNHIMQFDLRSNLILVQPGITIATLNEAVGTHGLTFPIKTDNDQAHTIGGVLGTNAVSENFAEYGSALDWVDRLEVVLANGEVIQTGRLNRRELSEKKGLETLEGEIYRSIDSLIEDNPETIDMISAGTTLDNGGFALDRVKGKDGSFDLTPLFVGSQGTLGIITEMSLNLTPTPKETSMLVAAVTDEQNLSDLTNRLIDTNPCRLSFIDGDTLALIKELSGREPWKLVTKSLPKALIFIEYDDKHQNRHMRQAGKILDSAAVADAKVAQTPEDQAVLATLYDSTAVVNNYSHNGNAALPLVTDLAVAPENVFDAIEKIRHALSRDNIQAGIWGNLAAGTICIKPILNLANLGHRQIVFRTLKNLAEIANQLEGSITGSHGAGRLLAPYARTKYDKETAEVFAKVEKIFDPFNTLNTDVKTLTNQEDLVRYLRKEYNTNRFSMFNPRG